MAFSINSNNSFFSRNFNKAQNRQNIAFQRLSSMNRINNARDDPAGSAIVNRLTAEINGNQQATRNANDGISLLQTAQSGLGQITSNLQRIRTLTLQASNSIVSKEGRNVIQNEINQLSQSNASITESSFNGQNIFPPEGKPISFQVGSNGGDGNQINVDLKSLNSLETVDVSSASAAQTSLEKIDSQLESVSSQASNFGAIENRLKTTTSVNQESFINAQTARSRIRDTDVAKEVSELIKAQILEKANIAITAQANQSRKSVLSLFARS